MGLLTDVATAGIQYASRGGGDGGKGDGGRRKKKKPEQPAGTNPDDIPQYKHGGKVRKTGLARVHKGERVLTRGQQRGMSMRGKRR
jgi:hypothetical protein